MVFLFSLLIALDSRQQLAVLTDGFFGVFEALGLSCQKSRQWHTAHSKDNSLMSSMTQTSKDWPHPEAKLLAPSISPVLTGCGKEDTVFLTLLPASPPCLQKQEFECGCSSVLSLLLLQVSVWRESLMAKWLMTLKNTHFWVHVDTKAFHNNTSYSSITLDWHTLLQCHHANSGYGRLLPKKCQ